MVLGDFNNDDNIDLLDLVLFASYLDIDDSGNNYFPEIYDNINETNSFDKISGIDGTWYLSGMDGYSDHYPDDW